MTKILPTFRWMSTRWIEFRFGYSSYIMFLLGFSNFALITYNFVPQIKDLIPLWAFVPTILVGIVPVGILAGRWHHSRHLPTETVIGARHNFYRDKIVPDSKEVFASRFAEQMSTYLSWHASVTERQMVALNDLMRERGKDPGFADKDISEALAKSADMAAWANRHREFISGKESNTLL